MASAVKLSQQYGPGIAAKAMQAVSVVYMPNVATCERAALGQNHAFVSCRHSVAM